MNLFKSDKLKLLEIKTCCCVYNQTVFVFQAPPVSSYGDYNSYMQAVTQYYSQPATANQAYATKVDTYSNNNMSFNPKNKSQVLNRRCVLTQKDTKVGCSMNSGHRDNHTLKCSSSFQICCFICLVNWQSDMGHFYSCGPKSFTQTWQVIYGERQHSAYAVEALMAITSMKDRHRPAFLDSDFCCFISVPQCANKEWLNIKLQLSSLHILYEMHFVGY